MKQFTRWLSALLSRQTRKPARKSSLRSVPQVETLEDRWVPSALSVSPNGVLTYTAGAGVANRLTVNLNPAGDTYTFSDVEVINAPGFLGNGTTSVSVPNAQVSSMRLLLGDAADTLLVGASQDFIVAQGGAGDDTVILGSIGGTLDRIQAGVDVSGDDGNDTLTFNDQGAAAGKNYLLTSSSLTRSGLTLVHSYGTLENLNLNTTGLNDVVSVRSTAAGSAVKVNAGLGDDALTVGGGAGGLDGFQGSLTFNGQDGRDALTVDDALTSAARSFTVTSAGVARSGSAGISYATAESLLVKAGAFDDTVAVQSTLASTPVTLNTGDGNDAITVGSHLDSIQGAVTVNGQAGSGDALNVSDAGGTSGGVFTITSVSVNRAGTALIQYGTVENVVVDGNNAYDSFVQSTAAGTAVTLNRFFSRVTVGSNISNPAASTLNTIQGTLTVSGTYDLVLNDMGTTSGQTYTVTSGSVSRPGMAQVNYDSNGQIFSPALTFNAGNFNDVVNVRGTSYVTFINLGRGDDTVNVNSGSFFGLGTIQGNLTVNGDPNGHAVVNVTDQVFPTALHPGDQTYYISPSTMNRASGAPINFNFASLVLNAASGNDTILVAYGAFTGRAITINAGDGADNVSLDGVVGNANSNLLGLLTINGQGGNDTLDYSDFVTSVRVNLALGTATGLTGFSGFENVTGGSANDVLVGDAGANILRGGAGRDLLIGGAGADQLFGDGGEDILIGNSTVLDTNAAALEAVMAEWGRTDVAYGLRVQHLKLGSGLNGSVKLDLTKLIEDNAQDSLTGDAGSLDWFFLTGTDAALDLNQPGLEQVN